MSRRAANQAEAPGQDSFLDVVANLVGVLIILVMVVGTQARQVAVGAAEKATQEKIAAATPELKAAQRDAIVREQALREMQARLHREELEVALRRDERNKFLLMCTAAEKQLELEKEKLSEKDKAEVEAKSAINQVQAELENLDRALVSTLSQTPNTEVVKHYPTPIAKTVFGKEVHFRLAEGRVAFVPFEEFVIMLKNDAPQKIWKLKDADRIVEQLGPLQGFQMRYALRHEQVALPTGGTMSKQDRAMLDQFILIPVQDNLGEPLAQALAPNSEFHATLRQYDPKQFTVTLWVYPDSFDQYRKVRDDLLKLGFISAARPMPEGHPIGGSPEGSRSAAQ